MKFWINPSYILGNWPKPGYKIFLVLPALVSYDTVILINSFISAFTVYLTYRLIKLLKIEYAYFGAVILAFQPLFFDLSFRSYAEIFTALLFLLLIVAYKKENYFFTGLICGILVYCQTGDNSALCNNYYHIPLSEKNFCQSYHF